MQSGDDVGLLGRIGAVGVERGQRIGRLAHGPHDRAIILRDGDIRPGHCRCVPRGNRPTRKDRQMQRGANPAIHRRARQQRAKPQRLRPNKGAQIDVGIEIGLGYLLPGDGQIDLGPRR